MNQTNSQTTYRDRLELTGEIFFDYFLPIFVGFALLFFCVYFVQFYVIADVNRFVTKLAAPPHPVFQPSIATNTVSLLVILMNLSILLLTIGCYGYALLANSRSAKAQAYAAMFAVVMMFFIFQFIKIQSNCGVMGCELPFR
jgi:heme/copper-type cytochrome/quinol oxidase subunit 3